MHRHPQQRESEARKAETEAKKAAKAIKDAEKKAVEDRKEQEAKKQRGLFGNWLAKAGTSPPVESSSSTPARPKLPASTSSGTLTQSERRSSHQKQGSVDVGTPGPESSALRASRGSEGVNADEEEEISRALPLGQVDPHAGYRRAFRPFKPRQGVSMAPINVFTLERQRCEAKGKGKGVKTEEPSGATDDADETMDDDTVISAEGEVWSCRFLRSRAAEA